MRSPLDKLFKSFHEVLACRDKMAEVLTKMGYIHVHTWYDGYGNSTQETWQDDGVSRAIVTLYLTHNHHMGQFDFFFGKEDGRNRDYLLAQEIRADQTRPPDEQDWERIATTTSPCATAGTETFRNRGGLPDMRICMVAGHGEYAYKAE